jgi:predicted RNase H-like HicB family nuclease
MKMKILVKTNNLKFKVPIIIEPDGDGFYAHSPALTGLMMDGDTEAEALKNARLAAGEMLTIMIKKGIPIPVSKLIPGNNKADATLADEKNYYEEEIDIDLK